MKKSMIAAVAVVIILLIAGAYVALSMNAPNDNGDDNGSDNNNDNNDNDDNTTDPTNTTTPSTIDLGYQTLNITFPASPVADPKIALSVSYPGQGIDGTTYNRSQTYRFQIQSTPAAGYSGDVLIRVFAELTDPVDEIDPQNIVITNATGRVINWTTDTRIGDYTNKIVISGDLGAFRTNGNATDSRTFDVLLNYVGNFTLTFQAFDLNTSAALSSPTVAGPMYVPIKGSLTILAKSGEWFTNETGTFYRVLVNMTNNWNIRHTVYASGFVLTNDTAVDFNINDTATSFDSQQLIPLGGTTQFMIYFDATDTSNEFTLRYHDQVTGEDYNVTMPLVG